MRNSQNTFEKNSESPAKPSGRLFVGIDVAKGKHCARGIYSLNNHTTPALFFDNRREGFEKLTATLLKWQQMLECREILIAMEPTADYWRPLFAFLGGLGLEVKLVSSLKTRRTKDLLDNSPLKSDKKDALVIARLLREGSILSYGPQEENAATVRSCIRHIEDLENKMGREKNHVEHYLSVHFPELGRYLSLRTGTLKKFLKKYPTPADVCEAGIEEIRNALREMSNNCIPSARADKIFKAAQRSIGLPLSSAEKSFLNYHLESWEEAERAVREAKILLESSLENNEQYRILKSIDGVNRMCAAAIIGNLGNLKTYCSWKQVLKKAGLNLFSHSSGNFKGRCHISRRGNGFLRRILFMSALSGTRRNSAFYEFYRSKRKNGMGFHRAMVALMRRILKVAFALVRDDRTFEKDYEPGAHRN